MHTTSDDLLALAQSKGYGSAEADTQAVSTWLSEKMSASIKTVGFELNNETVYGYHISETRNGTVKNYYHREETWLTEEDPFHPALNRALFLL